MDKVFLRNFLLFVVLLTVCAGGLVYHFIKGDRELGKIDELVLQTREVITEAEQLSARIKGMLVAQHDYLLTGNEEFLKEYGTKKSAVSEHIAQMKELTSDNPSQQSRLEDIRDSYKQLASILEEHADQPIDRVNKETLDYIKDINSLKDVIIDTNQAILEEEYELLNTRVAALQSKKTQYLTTLVIGVIVGAILLLLFNAFLLRAQRKRTVAEASLKDSEDRFSLALEGTQDGIFDWNIKEDKVFYSRRYFEMLGYDDKSYTGSIEQTLDLVHPEDIDSLDGAIKQYLDGGLSEFSQEFRLKHNSGRWVWVQLRARALFDQNGKAYRMVGANTDITHLKREQEKLEADKTRAEEANAAKSDFLAHMSHEIRTPLTAISGIAEILERNQDNFDNKQKKLVSTLNSSTSVLKDLINDILDFSKIESGDLELDEHVFELDKIFAEVISMMSLRANERGISFIFDDKAVKSTEFYGDDNRIRQILVNLIGNALKFTDAGGSVTVQAAFEDREEEKFLRIDVSDTGIGIDAENFDAVFERFRQADSSVSRKYGGTGLGLPISRNLARLMGGDIFISSKVDEGSTFSLLLPMKLEIAAVDKTASEQKDTNKKLSEKIQSSINDTIKALIVEDYEGNVIVIGYILDELNIEYEVANNGRQAVELWKQGYYDFILMDVQMPEMDGFAATSAIRKEEGSKKLDRTPIIGMTAHALVGDKDKCIAAGMDSYLPKPIVEADLKKTIYKHLKARKKKAA